MRWTRDLIEKYIDHYHALRNYDILPWQVTDIIGGQPAVRGQQKFESPFETQSILNAEFEIAIKQLGELGELTFRLYYLNWHTKVERQSVRRNVKKQLIKILLDSEKPPKKSGVEITKELLGGPPPQPI